MATCLHCERRVVFDEDTGYWVDPEATGDDDRWRAVQVRIQPRADVSLDG